MRIRFVERPTASALWFKLVFSLKRRPQPRCDAASRESAPRRTARLFGSHGRGVVY